MKKIKLQFSNDALSVLAMVPQRNIPRNQQRIARIRQNLFRELDALNRELKRHRAIISVG